MPENKEVTIYDVAEALDISPSTVSRSLKNNSAISDETIKKVQAQAEKMGYRSNIFAKNLRRKKTDTIGVIIPKLNSNFMSYALAGMEEIANQNGYNLIISQSLETVDKEISNVETMFENRVDGLIVSLAFDTTDLSHFDAITSNNIPLVFFDRVAQHESSENIVIDNLDAGYQATKHLLDQECRRIIHITGNMSKNVYRDRFQGYKKALEEYGVSFNESFLFVNDLSEQDGEQAANEILKLDPLPDAIFVANDSCAIACMSTLRKNGIKIPSEIAIVGFNNDPISNYVKPRLSTINYDGQEMGKVVARNLINHLNGDNNISVTNTIILNSELIVRDSSLKEELKN